MSEDEKPTEVPSPVAEEPKEKEQEITVEVVEDDDEIETPEQVIEKQRKESKSWANMLKLMVVVSLIVLVLFIVLVLILHKIGWKTGLLILALDVLMCQFCVDRKDILDMSIEIELLKKPELRN